MFDIQTKKKKKTKEKENKKEEKKTKNESHEYFVEIYHPNKISPFQPLDNNLDRFIRYDLYRSYIFFFSPNV